MFRPHSDAKTGSRRPAALRPTSGILEKPGRVQRGDVCKGLQRPPVALPPTWRRFGGDLGTRLTPKLTSRPGSPSSSLQCELGGPAILGPCATRLHQVSSATCLWRYPNIMPGIQLRVAWQLKPLYQQEWWLLVTELCTGRAPCWLIPALAEPGVSRASGQYSLLSNELVTAPST